MAKRKITKPASEAQKAARERNWNKGQILCLKTIANNIHQSKTTKNNEKILLHAMVSNLDLILKKWAK